MDTACGVFGLFAVEALRWSDVRHSSSRCAATINIVALMIQMRDVVFRVERKLANKCDWRSETPIVGTYGYF